MIPTERDAERPFEQFSFRLCDGRSGKIASAVLVLAGEAEARAKARVHLSAAHYFVSVEVRRGQELVCMVYRTELDCLGRTYRHHPSEGLC